METENKVILREDTGITELNLTKDLLDINKMGAAIMECLIENDTDGVMEILEGYLYAVNKTRFLKNANVPKTTFYNFIKSKNPTIKTLAKIMHATAK